MESKQVEPQLTLLDYLDHRHIEANEPNHNIQREFDMVVKNLILYSDAPRIYTIEKGEDGTHNYVWTVRTVEEWLQVMMEIENMRVIKKVADTLGVTTDEVAKMNIQIIRATVENLDNGPAD
jgi:hypothetical protein